MKPDRENGLAAWLPGGESLAREPDWLSALRARARERASSQGLPNTKQEAWRYAAPTRLIENSFVPAAPVSLTSEELTPHLIPDFDAYRLVLVNGRFAPELSDLADLPAGVTLGGLQEQLAADPQRCSGELGQLGGAPDQQPLFTALNTAGFVDGLVMRLQDGVILERPVVFVNVAVAAADAGIIYPRHLIHLGAGAQATLIERYITLGEGVSCTNAVLEVNLERDAILRHDRIQFEGMDSFHLSALHVEQDAGSRYQGVNVGLGSRWARTDLNMGFRGGHAECELQGLYLAGDGQLLDYHVDVDHSIPDCRSLENFKGILYGKGRAVFDGRALVRQDAQRTDASMTNRNLMLSEQAEVDSKPQLEIYADDVKCSHGTTVGQLDPEMLFYLRSRGIAGNLAQRMLCLGFAQEVIDALSADPAREFVTGQVAQRLGSAPVR